MGQIGNNATTLLAQLVDPYYYLPRYTPVVIPQRTLVD